MKNLIRHQHSKHKNSDMFSCTNCGHTTTRKHNLMHPMKIHASIHATPNLTPKVARHDPVPNIIFPPANDHLLEQLEQQEIQSMFDQNTQRGFELTQMSPVDVTCPDEGRQFFKMNSFGVQT